MQSSSQTLSKLEHLSPSSDREVHLFCLQLDLETFCLFQGRPKKVLLTLGRKEGREERKEGTKGGRNWASSKILCSCTWEEQTIFKAEYLQVQNHIKGNFSHD